MSDLAVNHAIERILRDGSFLDQILAEGQTALGDYDLADQEAAEILAAVRRDAREGKLASFESLRTTARFGPLFAAASASSTKVG